MSVSLNYITYKLHNSHNGPNPISPFIDQETAAQKAYVTSPSHSLAEVSHHWNRHDMLTSSVFDFNKLLHSL